jgi:hypothetical protein
LLAAQRRQPGERIPQVCPRRAQDAPANWSSPLGTGLACSARHTKEPCEAPPWV